MKKFKLQNVLCFALVIMVLLVLPREVAAETQDMVLVAADGTETASNQILADWTAGDYTHIKLYSDAELSVDGENLVIDLAGNDLTVTGTGSICVFDTANDTYNAAACGKLINNGTVTVADRLTAPNGNTYISVTENGETTAHRMDMKLSAVSLRTTCAGLYYKATFYCDQVLAEKVCNYGVALSLYNMPGADFASEPEKGNYNAWTVADKPFQSGITVTSGSVMNIMRTDRASLANHIYGNKKIYANAYVDLGNGPVVADTENPGKVSTDTGFTGIAMSLYDVMSRLNETADQYSAATRLQLDDFYARWKEKGMGGWNLGNIGTVDRVENSNLQFDEGTTDAVCPVCDTKVTWILVDQETYGAEGYGTIADNGAHICLAEDIIYSGSANFISAPTSGSKTACFHLNGHSLTALNHRAIGGSAGVLNVMGNGAVIGNYMDSAYQAYGAVMNINTNGAKGALNLYGGTYAAAAGNTQKTVISLHNNGGKLRIYEGAKVISDGYAVTVGTANLVPAELTIRGTVAGKVSLAGAAVAKGQTSTLNLDGGKIEGGLEIAANNIVNISGAPVIGGSGMILDEDILVTLDALTDGASIPVQAEGFFAEAKDDTAAYAEYFTSLNPATKIIPFDTVLSCQRDYSSDLKFAEDGKTAFCPVCEKDVQWTVLTEGAKTMVKDTHYYLDSTITHTEATAYLTGATASSGAGLVCLHLNGHDIIATQYRAINVAYAKLNIMGNGTISGNCNSSLGATVYEGYPNGCLNLYSGKIVKAESNTRPTLVFRKTSALELKAGTRVEGGITLAEAVTDQTALSIDGATVTGTVTVNGGNVALSGATKIEKMVIAEGVLMDLGKLAMGTDVTVSATGYFTTTCAQAARYKAYFTSADPTKPVESKGGALSCKADPADDDTLYILTAAASNSHYFTDELYSVLAAAGVKAKVCNLMKDSTGINLLYDYWQNDAKEFQLIIHDENGKTTINDMGFEDALQYYNWDIFNMQEGTAPHRNVVAQEGGTSTSTPQKIADDRRVAHTALIARVREVLPLAKLYYQEIWSYDIGFDRFNYKMTTLAQQLAFSASIKEYTDIVCAEFDLDTIPCGQAWIIARESGLCDTLCARLSFNNGEGDYYHDGDIGGGQYLNACVWFETLTGQSCVGNTFRPVYTDSAGNTYELSEELITVLQEAAHQAVANMRAEN